MKKYVIYLMFAVAMWFVLPSCDRGPDVDFANNTLTLTLSCNNLGLTRATVDGENDRNENLVEYIDCYFYEQNAGFEVPAKLVKNRVRVRKTDGTVGTYTATIPFENEELETIFGTVVANGSSANCLIYVIANRPENVNLPEEDGTLKLATIRELKEFTVSSNFITEANVFNPQSSFVMDSDGKPNTGNDTSADGNTNVDIPNDDIVTLNVAPNGTKTLSGTVPLYRTAAKVTLNITRFGPEKGNGVFVDTKGTDATNDDVTYVPNLNKIYAVFHNGVKQSHIAPDVVPNSDLFGEGSSPLPYFNTGNFVMTPTEGEVKSTLANPFYSYASDWSASGVNKEAYITLVVPWGVKNSDNTITDEKEYFYKVPINYDGDKLERNTHYKINIAVSILGTLDPTKTIEINPSYTILDWSSDTIGTAMSDFRYLMVEKNHYEMDNIDSIEIPYWTSHNCTIVNISVKKPDLSNGTIVNVPSSDYTLTLRDGHIFYKKVLNNNFKDRNFDFTTYTIKFRIQHTTESATYYEDIEIIQYPAIYGSQDINTDATNGGDDNGNKGFVWVNGYRGDSRTNTVVNQDYFSATTGLSQNTGVTSTTMLVFNVSSVKNTKYVIGDPREMSVNTGFVGEKHTVNRAEYSIWDEAPGVEGGDVRYLQNYYATYTNHSDYNRTTNSTANIYANETEAAAAERTYNMIAPKFRISSGYGAISDFGGGENQYYHYMKKRCASYQEDGYPAGRWRLPTKAEFEFIVDLSYKGKVPLLFNNTLHYWCAHGHGSANTSAGTVSMTHSTYYNNSMISVRCVYDDWYWGSDPVIDTENKTDHFIWGDVNRASYAPPMNH